MRWKRDIAHSDYTSKIVSVVLEEQNRRCSDLEFPIIISCTAGSSGHGNKKDRIALPCVSVPKSKINQDNTARESWMVSLIIKQSSGILVPTYKSRSIFRLRWIHSSLPKNKRDPNKGDSSSGATGAGRAARADGHKTCSEAMAASGSSSRPQTGGGEPTAPDS